MSINLRHRQSWFDTVLRTIKAGFRKSERVPPAFNGPVGCARDEMIGRRWNDTAWSDHFDDPRMHEALDRLMAGIPPI